MFLILSFFWMTAFIIVTHLLPADMRWKQKMSLDWDDTSKTITSPLPQKGAGIMKKLLTLSTRGNWMEPCGVSPSEEHPCAEIEGIAVIGRPEGQTMADCWPFPQTVFFLQGYEHFRENQWLPSSMLYFLVPSQLCVTTKVLSVECGWGDTCIAGVISCPRHLLEIPISALQPGKAQEDNILGVMGQKYIYSLSLLVISWSSVTCVFRPIFYSTH